MMLYEFQVTISSSYDHRRDESRSTSAPGKAYADFCYKEFQSRLAPGEAVRINDRYLPWAVLSSAR